LKNIRIKEHPIPGISETIVNDKVEWQNRQRTGSFLGSYFTFVKTMWEPHLCIIFLAFNFSTFMVINSNTRTDTLRGFGAVSYTHPTQQSNCFTNKSILRIKIVIHMLLLNILVWEFMSILDGFCWYHKDCHDKQAFHCLLIGNCPLHQNLE
jgi:hypothetical protein